MIEPKKSLQHDRERCTVGSLDQRARIEVMVRDHYATIWRLARRWGLSSADADDAAQRAIIIASSRIAEVKLGCERAFLCRTALFLASKARRSCRRRAEETVENWESQCSNEPNPEQLLEHRRARAQLDGILEELPEGLRAVFVLFELELLSQAEIADTLQIPMGTVASRLRRARELVTESIGRNVRNNQRIRAVP